MKVTDLYGRNIVVYDCEIKKEIAECSRGWASHDEMGISVACAFDYRDMAFKVFMDDNIGELVDRLNEPETIIVGFNTMGFDNKLLRVNGLKLRPDAELINYDLLHVSRRGAGMDPNSRTPGFKLDDHLKALGLKNKSGDGAAAPGLWKAGKLGTLISYCLTDAAVERALFEHFYITGQSACSFRPNPYPIARLQFPNASPKVEEAPLAPPPSPREDPASVTPW